jgi:predicted ATPase
MDRVLLDTCEVDLLLGRVYRSEEELPLTSRECELFAYLVAREGQDVHRTELLTEVWGYAPTAQTRAIDQMIRKLRDKLEADRGRPRHLLTVIGVGYRFEGLRPASERYGDPFVGRAELLDTLHARLARPGAVWLHGPPGAGKTRLAWELLQSRPGWFCELAGSRSETEVVERVAAALGVTLERGATAEQRLQQVGAALATRMGLLVLDNAEPLDLGGVLPRWLAAAPQLRVVVTSQHPVAAAQRVAVPGLGDSGPVLFLARARARWGALTIEPAEVALLCARLDGLPLAIELAAARVRLLSVRDMLARLDRQLALLRRTDQAGPHATLEAAIRWAWDLLDDRDRDTLSRLAVFPGGFEAEAAEVVLGADALDRVDRVEQTALVQATRAGADVRLRLYEAVRAFVLVHRPPPSEAWSAHLDHRLVTDLEPVELGNTLAALDWAIDHAPDRAASLLARLLKAPAWQAPLGERLARVQAVLAAGATGEDAEHLVAHQVRLVWVLDRRDEATELAVAGMAQARTANGRARITHMWALLLLDDEPEEALRVIDDVLDQVEPASHLAFTSLRTRALALRALGRRGDAITTLEQAITNARARGHEGNLGDALLQLGQVAVIDGGPQAAAGPLTEAAAAYDRAGDTEGLALAASARAAMALELGRPASAEVDITTFEAHARHMSHREWLRGVAVLRANVALEAGQIDRALELLVAIDPRRAGPEARTMATALLSADRPADARAWLAEDHDHDEDRVLRACLRRLAGGDASALATAEAAATTPIHAAMVRAVRTGTADAAGHALAEDCLELRQLLRLVAHHGADPPQPVPGTPTTPGSS